MKKQCIRHGEVVFVKIDKIPNLEETKTNVFAKGKTGNNHTFKGGKIYLKEIDQHVFGYFKADKTKLYHVEHSPKGASIPNGNYELRRQVEFINGELKQVVD
jgi:hypothetical protein